MLYISDVGVVMLLLSQGEEGDQLNKLLLLLHSHLPAHQSVSPQPAGRLGFIVAQKMKIRGVQIELQSKGLWD